MEISKLIGIDEKVIERMRSLRERSEKQLSEPSDGRHLCSYRFWVEHSSVITDESLLKERLDYVSAQFEFRTRVIVDTACDFLKKMEPEKTITPAQRDLIHEKIMELCVDFHRSLTIGEYSHRLYPEGSFEKGKYPTTGGIDVAFIMTASGRKEFVVIRGVFEPDKDEGEQLGHAVIRITPMSDD